MRHAKSSSVRRVVWPTLWRDGIPVLLEGEARVLSADEKLG